MDVINKSLGWVWHGPGDGTSPFSLSPLKSVDAAVAGGITWLNAAGNGNGKTWFGAFTNEYHNSESGVPYHESTLMHEFAHMDECNAVELTAERAYLFQLRWDDSWGAARDDLDLFLYRGETVSRENVVAYSNNDQDGGMFPLPFEGFIFSPESSGTYCIGVMFWSGFSPDWIQIEMWGGRETFEHHTLSHSITHPADSANPGMLAVGAAAASSTATIEPYSSRGPTNDGRVKPDIVGVDKADSSIYGRWSGTSQSSPHVAGLAALVKQRLPSHTPQQIAQYLKTHAEERGEAGPDNTWGHGFATLPVSDVTAQCQPAGAPGLTVTGLTATATYDTVSLSWNAPSGGATATGYKILRRAVDSEQHFQVLSADTDGTSTTWIDSSVSARTKYSYRVCALDERGGGDLSTNATVMTDFAPLPGRVTGLTRTATHDTVWLRWDAPIDGAEVTGYKILRRAVDSERDFSVLKANTLATSTTWTDSGVSARTRYSYRVRAHGVYGEGELSKPATVITDPIPPNSPATGAPTIYGTALVGETLTASPFGIYDADGSPSWGEQYSYQWLADAADISGATSYEYLLTEADLGKFIKVRLSFTDLRGHDETITSAATEAVAFRPLTASFAMPYYHDGSTPFRFGLEFSEDFPGEMDEEKLRDAFQVENGSSTLAARSYEGHNRVWGISVRPDSLEDVVITLPATTDCSAAGAVCTESGRPLSNTITATVLANSTATGTPTIIGTAQVGETLTVSGTSTISDADGLDNATFYYRWYTDGSYAWARGSSYTLALADEGKAISVKVSFTDDAGFREYLFSTSTEAVAPPPPPPPPPEVIGVEVVSTPESGDTYAIGESIKVQVTFTAEVISFGPVRLKIKMDPNYGEKWATVHQFPDNGIIFKYEVVEPNFSTQGIAVPENALDLNGGSISTWDEIRVNRVRATDVSHDGLDHDPNHKVDWTLRPDLASVVMASLPNTYTGDTFTATSGLRNEGEGPTDGWLFYYRSTDTNVDTSGFHVGAAKVPEVAASSSIEVSHTMTAPYAVGTYYYVACVWAKEGESDTTNNCSPVQEMVVFGNSPATGAPTISGVVRVGQTLTADTSGISDADGLTNATSSYQWLADDADISGATSSTYTLVDADKGKAIKVRVSFTDDEGYDETLTSAATAEVTAAPPAPPENSPAAGAPTITGTARVGETLTAARSGISDADGLNNASFKYQWLADDADISGATRRTYLLATADKGKAVKVRVSFTDDAGHAETLTSAATAAVVVETAPVENSPAAGAPLIRGTARVGETLTARTPRISDGDGLTNATFSYQWLADDADISGATSSTYTLGAADEGKAVKVRVSFTDDEGNDEALTSVATSAVAAALPRPAPTNLVVSDNGNGTLTLSWDAPDDDSVTGYQVLRRRPNEGEKTLLIHVADTGSTDTTLTDEDVTIGTQHVYRVKAISAAGLSGASNLVRATPASPPENNAATGTPTISGTAQVGETLTAGVSGTSDADGLTNATFSYQWIVDDADISGPTSSTYTMVAVDEGTAIKVRVSFTDDAGHAESLTSAATVAVTAATPPDVTGVAVTSSPTSGDTYALGETIQVTLTFSEAVDVTGTPRLRVKMDPNYGEKWATYESGSGTTSLSFAYEVVEPNESTQGVAVLANTLELNGGTIKSTTTEADGDLAHTGLAHDPNHKVDWQ